MMLPAIRQFKKNAVCFYRHRLEHLANDDRPFRAPFVSMPVSLSYTDKQLTCIVVRRDHLRAALSARDVSHVEYDAEAGRLIISGKLTRYALVDLMRSSCRYSIQKALSEWSAGIRAKRARAAVPKEVRRAEKIRHAIEVQERRLARIHLAQPVNPLCVPLAKYAGNYYRNAESEWAAKRVVRRQLAKLTGEYIRFRKTPKWKAFYERAEQIVGHPIPETVRHSRVIRSRHFHGDFVDYLQAVARYVDGQQKPWRRDTDGFQAEAMRAARDEYLAAKREADSIRQQIAVLEGVQ